MDEVSISVTFTGIMAAATFFSIPVLLGSYRDSLFTVMFFLIVSMFGYIYSTAIYANASGHVSRLKRIKGENILSKGNIVSEYFGVYYTAFAFPIAFLAFTGAELATATFIVDVLGIILYHLGGFSILERYTIKSGSHRHPKQTFHTLVVVLVLLMSFNFFSTVLFGGNIANPAILLSAAAITLFTLLLAIFSFRRIEA